MASEPEAPGRRLRAGGSDYNRNERASRQPAALRTRRPGKLASAVFMLSTLIVAVSMVLVLLDLAAALRAPTAPAAPSFLASEVLARRFYAAVDDVLRTGDTALLADIAAPAIVEHPARAGAAPGRDGLAHALLSLRAEGYGLLEIETITGIGKDVLRARLHRARLSLARYLDEQGEAAAIPTRIGRRP